MNDAQIKATLKTGQPGRYRVEKGLYFRISHEGTGFWIYRYTINGKRREITLGQYGKGADKVSLSDAKLKSANTRALINQGVDPLAEKKRAQQVSITTVNHLAEDWLREHGKRIENPQIPERVYRKDIAPTIGGLSLERVNPRDIRAVLLKINESNRPSIANDALTYLKQLFNHGIKYGLVQYNPASAFSPKDAGGTEKSRSRILSIEEIKVVFQVLSECKDIFTRENYLAVALLLVLGVRKGELIAAKWEEFDFDNLVWKLNGQRTKTRESIQIPIPKAIVPWFEELRVRSLNSEYVFPSRRASKRRGYISDDTLNHALAKMFGMKVDANKLPYPNFLGDAGIEHFVVHDLRRTCRSLLARNGVPSHIAERCLNHKIRGVEGVYDRYDYFNERKDALECLAHQIIKCIL